MIVELALHVQNVLVQFDHGLADQLLFFARQGIEETLFGDCGGDERRMPGKDHPIGDLVEAHFLNGEHGVFLAVDHVQLQSAVHLGIGQRGGTGSVGLESRDQQRRGHHTEFHTAKVVQAADRPFGGPDLPALGIDRQQLHAFTGIQLVQDATQFGIVVQNPLVQLLIIGKQKMQQHDLDFGNQFAQVSGRSHHELDCAQIELLGQLVRGAQRAVRVHGHLDPTLGSLFDQLFEPQRIGMLHAADRFLDGKSPMLWCLGILGRTARFTSTGRRADGGQQ